MTPEAFVSKWSQTTTKERASAQEHFIDLCHLLGEKTPNEADPAGEWYAFEKGVEKTGAGRGWADVWKRGHFGWEYKSKSGGRQRTMSEALKQLQLYALALESPPLLIVSDIDTIEIHTAFQNAVQETHVIELASLSDAENMHRLHAVFKDPSKLKPSRTRDQITSSAAGQFAQLAFDLRNKGHDSQVVAHFVNKLLFAMFAEDIDILKKGMFSQVAETGVKAPEHFDLVIKRLFQAMRTGGPFGTEIVDWFNGGLYDDDLTISLELDEIRKIRDLAKMDWSQINPAIFGTLFERGLDPDKRSQLGAHYTDYNSIMRLVEPTIIAPLTSEWNVAKTAIASHIKKMESVKTKAASQKRLKAAEDIRNTFLERLRKFRVLDPACGSGNFLYVSLLALKDIEHQVNIEAEAIGLERQNPLVGPECVLGIELSTYAAELARITVWIGEIQWMLGHGYAINTNPVLQTLDNIDQGDAIVTAAGEETEWPSADVIIGNPPFIGDKRMRAELGDEYVNQLRKIYSQRVSSGSDLVTFWFEKARNHVVHNNVTSVGLVATNSIRQKKNRNVLKNISEDTDIYCAWSDQPWVNDGADVRVSLVCFRKNKAGVHSRVLDGVTVESINSDLTAGGLGKSDLTKAIPLAENKSWSFFGLCLAGDFDVDENIAREWLEQPNPSGNPNSDVLRPIYNGKTVMQRKPIRWVIDFGASLGEIEASHYELPFLHVEKNVKPLRLHNRRPARAKYWWRHGETRPGLRKSLVGLDRFIATVETTKHRVFSWFPVSVAPEHNLIVIPRNDDQTFGILSSRIHVLWATSVGGRLGVGNDPRYNSTRCFQTFAFPEGLTLDLSVENYSNRYSKVIAESAANLNRLRLNWLNPKEWLDTQPETVPHYPDRIIVKLGKESDIKKRTLTKLYNIRPTWLDHAHRELDEAVAAAYGWRTDLTDDEVLANLLELNMLRVARE